MAQAILVVDDGAINRKLLCKALSEDYDTIEAANGLEALALVERFADRLCAILTDIVMPEMDGYELLKRIRGNAALPSIPVIMVTGSEDEQSRVKALMLGANDFITKPFNPDIVRHCVRNNCALFETSSILNTMQKDKLTGLYNREAFFGKVDAAIHEHEPGYYILSCFDIDNFKLVNDQYGTVEGDRILREVGRTVNEDMKVVGGFGGRVSGDNLAVLLPYHEREMSITRIVQQNRMAFADKVAITFSVGRSVVSDLSLPASAIYDRAYIAKQSVKGRYDTHIAYFDDAMLESLVRGQQIIADMDEAIEERQFEVWFQPQHNHVTGALVGAEALVRWRHPERGLISPGDFIPIFEQNGFIYELDKYVWETTCAYLRKWLDEGRDPLPVSMNISRYDIFRSEFIDAITGLVEKYAIPVDLLRLEVTESAFAKSTKTIVSIVRQLIDRGFTVEIDDFGSGYSSLNTLKSVPAQIVKLDMRFLEEDDDSGRGGNILESVVRMTKWLGMSVIAEGVEEKPQADYLASVGCSYIQGFLYARPMPAADYEAYCRNARKEEHLLSMDAVANLDNNSFWDPKSMDTLIFNSFVGGACIYEYHQGRIELLRATEKYAQTIGNASMTIEDALKLDMTEHIDEESLRRVGKNLEESARTHKEVTDEYLFVDIPGCPHETLLRSTMRVIATAGDRSLVYCTNENITAQWQAEQRERASQQKVRRLSEQLQTIMDNVDLGIIAVVVENGTARYLFANNRYYEMLGYTESQFEAEVPSPYATIAEAERQRVMDETASMNRTERSAQLTYTAITRDGRERIFQAAISTAHLSGIDVPAQFSIIRDVTETRAMQSRLELLTNSIPGGLAVYEGDPHDPTNIKLAFFSEGLCRLFGYAREEYAALAAENPLGLVLAADMPDMRKNILALVRDNVAMDFVYRVKAKDDSTKWINVKAVMGEASGQGATVNAVFFDVTERQSTMEKLRISEEVNRLAILQSGSIVCQYDIGSRQLAVSPNMDPIFEFSAIEDDIPAKVLRENLVSPETLDAYTAFYARIQQGAKSGEALFQRHSTLGWRWVEEHFATIFSETGEPVLAVISFADVTEGIERDMAYQKWQQSIRDRKPESYSLYHCNVSKGTVLDAKEGIQTLKSLAGTSSLAERTARYAAQYVCDDDRDRFLSVADWAAQLLRFAQGKRSDSLEYREVLADGATRWLRLTIDLVSYASSSDVEAYLLFENIDEAKRTELDILERAETDPLTGLLNRKAFEDRFERLMCTRNPEALLALLIIDLDGFKQVNDNYGHAVGDETLIEMGQKLSDAFRDEDLVCRLGGDEYLVCMSGVSHLAAIRERASLVCSLLHKSFSLEVQLSASVGVSVCPDNGDDFETLYRKADAALYHIKSMGRNDYAFYAESMGEKPPILEAAEDDDGESPFVSHATPKRRMLIVEDNEINRDYLANLFDEEFIIDTAADGTAALIRLQRYGAGISIVLLDLMMPGLDGFAVLRKMRENLAMQAIPVIVVSGMNEHETCLEAIREGASDYITKPVDADLLKLRVASALSKAENEQLRARNRYLAIQNEESRRLAEARHHSEELSVALHAAERADLAKSQFLSSMSHEIRTPLNAVIGYNTLARSDMDAAKTDADRRQASMKVLDYLTKSEVASKHLLTIINDVLDMSAIESGKMKVDESPFDFRGLITSLTVMFFSQARAKGVTFEVLFDKPTEEWLVGDQMRVNQILTNLLSNAVKFTPEGGTVTLTITETACDQATTTFRFVVADTGIGMTQEYLEHIWTPFEQAEASISRRFGGSGLGLSITKSLVDLMGGSISVTSASGSGSAFAVDLTFSRTAQPARPANYDFSHVNALVVDDDMNTCDYIKLLFDRCGARCMTFTSGREAVRAFASADEQGSPFNICLVDWRMPQMDGFATISEIRRLSAKKLPVVVVTAYDFGEIAEHAEQLGISRFISKPLFQSSLFDLLITMSGQQPSVQGEHDAAYDFGGARVLLAEDNGMNMEVAKHLLVAANLAVDCAWNGQEAIDLFAAARPGTYGAVLMDVHMPEVDGYEATRMIRASGHPDAQHVPIIAMTADVFAEDIAEAHDAGMNGHIAKPIDIDALFSLLSTYLGGSKA